MQKYAPQKGNLIIAAPSLSLDSSFGRTVVLISEHNESGSVGFILNKPLGIDLRELMPDLNCNSELYGGGPVERDSLYFLHQSPELIPDSIEISNGIYWGGDFNKLKELINQNAIDASSIKFFLGYAGWSETELEEEIEEKSWIISDLKTSTNNIINTKDKHLWRNKMRELGGNYILWSNSPSDPSFN
ncbi:MAG: YqgE/AlgH family protein [Ichthyobacteriaceae bacterium]|nr:YqgE/AlgH family protein [Ichthyobacteriaceae bacterium]